MKSGGDGGRKKSDGEAMPELGTVLLEVETPAAPASEDGQGEQVHVEGGGAVHSGGAAAQAGGDGQRAEEGGGGGEEEGEEGGEETDGEEEEEGEEERPKLEDGFYEIEDIRKKRVRKGQLQFLIKWRGWPEAANTWEPYENVQSCADIIEAFEDRLRTPKSTRKRKRKNSGSYSVSRKKRIGNSKQGEGIDASPRVKEKKAHGSHTCNGVGAGGAPTEADGGEMMRLGEGEGCADDKNMQIGHGSCGNGSVVTEELDHSNKEPNSAEPSGLGSKEEGAGPISIYLHPLEEDRLSKIESLPPLQSGNRYTGAKKRKSGCIRRFKQDSSVCKNDTVNLVTRSMYKSSMRGERMGKEDADSTGGEAGARYTLDDSKNPDALIKILKAVAFSASVSNDMQDVSVTFVALRSDGEEVQVNNEFLKANYPMMLIDFYEQHLRFASS